MCETYIDEIEYAQTRAIGNQVVTIDCSLSGTTDRLTDGRTDNYISVFTYSNLRYLVHVIFLEAQRLDCLTHSAYLTRGILILVECHSLALNLSTVIHGFLVESIISTDWLSIYMQATVRVVYIFPVKSGINGPVHAMGHSTHAHLV